MDIRMFVGGLLLSVSIAILTRTIPGQYQNIGYIYMAIGMTVGVIMMIKALIPQKGKTNKPDNNKL